MSSFHPLDNGASGPTIHDIIQATAEHYQLPVEAVTNKKARHLAATCARHVAMYIANRIAFFSQDEIAEVFGVHRTCVTHAANRVELTRRSQGDIKAIRDRLSFPSPLHRGFGSDQILAPRASASMPSPTWSGNPVIPRLARWLISTFVSPIPRMEVAS